MAKTLSLTSLFATQIHHEKLVPNSKKLAQIVKDIHFESVQIQKMDKAGHLWSKTNYPNGYTSYSSQDKLHKMSSTFETLDRQIQTHVQKFLKSLDYNAQVSDLKMTDCWVNIMTQNAAHTAHIHPCSVISGTFYVAVPKGASPLKFQDPRFSQFMNTPSVKLTAKVQNQRFVAVPSAPGDVILFESWLSHEVPLNLSKDPRISVSFNYDWK